MADENILNTSILSYVEPTSIAEGKTGNALVSEATDHIIAVAQNVYDTGQTVHKDADGNKVYTDITGGVKGYQTEINALFNQSIAGLRDNLNYYVPINKWYSTAIPTGESGHAEDGYFNFDKLGFAITFGTSMTASEAILKAQDRWTKDYRNIIFTLGSYVNDQGHGGLVIGSGQFYWDWVMGSLGFENLGDWPYGKTFIRSDFGFLQFGNDQTHWPCGVMKLTNNELFIGSGQINLGTDSGVNIDAIGVIRIGTIGRNGDETEGVEITSQKIRFENVDGKIEIGSDLTIGTTQIKVGSVAIGTQLQIQDVTIGNYEAKFPAIYALHIGTSFYELGGEKLILGTLGNTSNNKVPWGIQIGTSQDSGVVLGTNKILVADGEIQIGTSRDSGVVLGTKKIQLNSSNGVIKVGSTTLTNGGLDLYNSTTSERNVLSEYSIKLQCNGVDNILMGVRTLETSSMGQIKSGLQIFYPATTETYRNSCPAAEVLNDSIRLYGKVSDINSGEDPLALLTTDSFKLGTGISMQSKDGSPSFTLGSGILMISKNNVGMIDLFGGPYHADIYPNYSRWYDDTKNSYVRIGTQDSTTLASMNWEDWGLSVKNNDRTTYITGTGIIIDTDGGLYFGTDQILSSQGFSRSRALSIKYRDTFNAEKTFEYRGGDSSNNQNTIDLSGGVYYATTSQTATRVANPLTIHKADGSTIEYNGSIKGYEVVEGGVCEITYNKLKKLRDAGELSPGVKYRITDYKTTVNTSGYSTTNHKFDIIVEAINKNTLSENAQVCTSNDAGDDYNLSGYVHNLNIGPNNWYEPNKIPQDIISMGLTRDDVKYCDTPKYEIEKCKLEVTFTWVQNSGNKKYNFVGVELIKDGVVISSDYHRGFAGTTVSNNIYTLHVPESGEYSFIFYASTIDQNNAYEEINSTCNALTAKFVDKKYFSNSKLSSWVVKYCLDNDNSRFVWAKSDGKGVIYYLKDENENEAQYDFKNILIDGYYTFDYEINGNHVDGSVLYGKYCHHNKIMFDVSGPPYMNPGLPKIYFKNTSADAKCYYNIFANDIWSIIFGSGCYKNIFETGSEGNTLGDNCYHNVFGAECKNNTMGDNCHHNVFDCECTGSKMGDNCYHNVFGRGCKNNIIGDNCNHNHLQCGCTGISIGDNCIENSFGFNCHSTGENDYEKIQLADGCCYNTIGNDCSGIKLQENCKYNHIGDGSSKIGFKAEGQHNLVEMGWSGTNSNCINGLNGNNIQYIKDANDVQYRMDGFAIDTDIMNLFNSN